MLVTSWSSQFKVVDDRVIMAVFFIMLRTFSIQMISDLQVKIVINVKSAEHLSPTTQTCHH